MSLNAVQGRFIASDVNVEFVILSIPYLVPRECYVIQTTTRTTFEVEYVVGLEIMVQAIFGSAFSTLAKYNSSSKVRNVAQ